MMARDWAAWLDSATAPASPTEEADRDRTEERIRDAISKSAELGLAGIRVYAKGSYAHRTNVRGDADVDVAVEWQRSFLTHRAFQAKDLSDGDLGLVDARLEDMIAATELRARVERAMLAAFGSGRVDVTGRHAIKVERGSTTLDADVVPCFLLRRYDSATRYHLGSRLFPTSGPFIDNFPRQHYDNGVEKNRTTGQRYKRVVRCLKRLEDDLRTRGIIVDEVAGYVIECLVWNVPDPCFNRGRIIDDVRSCLNYLWTALSDPARCRDFAEVCDLVYLYRGSRRHEPSHAFVFVDRALDEIGAS